MNQPYMVGPGGWYPESGMEHMPDDQQMAKEDGENVHEDVPSEGDILEGEN